MSKEHGFLPTRDPLERLPSVFAAWEDVAADLSKLLVSDYLRQMLADLPSFAVERLASDREIERAMVLLSYLGRNLPSLHVTYNECVRLVQRFRTTHLEYAGRYVHKQSLEKAANPNEIGTGGTSFMVYLKKHKEETTKYLL